MQINEITTAKKCLKTTAEQCCGYKCCNKIDFTKAKHKDALFIMRIPEKITKQKKIISILIED